MGPPEALKPEDLDIQKFNPEVRTDICQMCHIQHERPVASHEFMSSSSGSSSSSSEVGNPNETQELSVTRSTHHKETGEQTQAVMPSSEDQSAQDVDTTARAVGGETLLNIPPCSMAEELGEQSQRLFRPLMSDSELNLERRRGAKPKAVAPLTTQTIQEEARAASTEQCALQLRGTDFYLPLGGQPRISKRKSWRVPIVTEQGNPGIYVQIDEWLPLYKGNIYVVDEITGRMYLSKV